MSNAKPINAGHLMGFARLNPILRPLFALLRLAGKKCLIGTKSPLQRADRAHTRRGTERDRFVADSALEGDGFELPVPRDRLHFDVRGGVSGDPGGRGARLT